MKKLMKSGLFVLFTLMATALPTRAIWADGGGESVVEGDSCRIQVAGHWVNFAAYTPAFTAYTKYCTSIPNLGMTDLVFDYEGRKLRKMTVEFEITKEPEGTQIYYQEPKVHKTGSVNTQIDFSKYGPGHYMAHVTLVNEGKRTDQDIPITVGGEAAGGSNTMLIVAVVAVGALVGLYFLSPAFKQKVNGMLGGGGGEAAR